MKKAQCFFFYFGIIIGYLRKHKGKTNGFKGKNAKMKKIVEKLNIIFKKGCAETRKRLVNLPNTFCFCLFTFFESQHVLNTMKKIKGGSQ